MPRSVSVPSVVHRRVISGLAVSACGRSVLVNGQLAGHTGGVSVVEQQTLIALIGLVVAVVALIVGFASLLHFSQKSLKEDLGKRIDGVQHQLGERITGVENQLGERIDQLDSRLTTVEGKVTPWPKPMMCAKVSRCCGAPWIR